MSAIPQEWVEKVAAVLEDAANAGGGLGCVGPTTHQVAHVALASVVPDVRRQVAEAVSARIRNEYIPGGRAFLDQYDDGYNGGLEIAVRIAREAATP